MEEKRETYGSVCSSHTEAEAKERFERLLGQVVAKYGGTPESHRAQQLENVGYFTGYFGPEQAKQVMEWLGCAHPIFGRTRPDAAAAFKAGEEAAND